jgi:hypothetical protein
MYVAATQVALATRAAEGNLVYHGLAGGLLLRGAPCTLHTRLIAPLDLRTQSLMDTEKMSEEEAEAYIRDVDDARARWVRTLYGEDINDPGLYDQVINFSSFSPSEACDILVEAASQPEFQVTPERLAKFDDFRIGCEVRLAFLEDLGTQTLDLEATCEDGVVTITGQAPMMDTGEVGDRITEIATSVEGVRKAKLSVEWFDPYP